MRSNSQSKALHFELWDWLARHPGACVSEWPKWADIPVSEWPRNMSFACDVAMRTCHCCPVNWGGKGFRCFDQNSIYDLWMNSRIDIQPFYAWQIRDGWKKD